MKKIWITWEHHRRTIELAKEIKDLQLFELKFDSIRLIRYPWLLIKTAWILIRNTPDLVIVQNPSIVLAFFMTTIGKLFVKTVIVDAHNAGLKPYSKKLKKILPIYHLIQRRADLTIVTNINLAIEVKKNGGYPFILEDSIPNFGAKHKTDLQSRAVVVFICTFSSDEPFEEVIEAAKFTDPQIKIYITGNFKKAFPEISNNLPTNVKFTGFLSEPDYIVLLNSCDIIMDLTTRKDCLVCGAYEAVALGKPLVLSKTEALMRYFHSGAIYTENNVKDIADAINLAIFEKVRLGSEIKLLREEMIFEWHKKINELEKLISDFINA